MDFPICYLTHLFYHLYVSITTSFSSSLYILFDKAPHMRKSQVEAMQ